MKKERMCLRCSERFQSEGPWNRICPLCRAVNAHVPKVLELKLPLILDPADEFFGQRTGRKLRKSLPR